MSIKQKRKKQSTRSNNDFSAIGSHDTLMQKARRLRLSAKTIASGMRSGSFRSMYHGHGVEFSGVREYLRGDDVRSIDWNVTARMGKPFVKIFEEERELIMFFVVDTSLSMYTGSGSSLRIKTASEIGAILTIAGGINSSPLGGVFFDGEIGFSCPPESGKDREMLMLSHFDKISPSKVKGSALSNALRGAYKLLKKRSLVIVISDFRTTDYTSALSTLALKHDVIALRITDPSDSHLPEIGTLFFTDTESSYKRKLSLCSSAFIKFWAEQEKNRHDRFVTMCLKTGVLPLSISTDDDASFELSRFFASRISKWQH